LSCPHAGGSGALKQKPTPKPGATGGAKANAKRGAKAKRQRPANSDSEEAEDDEMEADGEVLKDLLDGIMEKDGVFDADDLQKIQNMFQRKIDPLVTQQQECSETVTALQKRCTALEQNASSRPDSGRVDASVVSQMQSEMSKKDDTIRDLRKRQKELYTAIGLVGSVVSQLNILVGLQNAAINKDTVEKLTASAYNNVINQINNNFNWPADMKRAFYGSFQDITAFANEYKALGEANP
jgi:hypothetical protein